MGKALVNGAKISVNKHIACLYLTCESSLYTVKWMYKKRLYVTVYN